MSHDSLHFGIFCLTNVPEWSTEKEAVHKGIEQINLADKLGFEEAFIGEHVTDLAETITNCLIFIATLARDTKRIRLGSGTVNLANRHPALTAARAARLSTRVGRDSCKNGPKVS